MAKAKTQQKRWHLDGGIEVTSVEEGGKSSPSTYLGNYNTSNKDSLALVAYTGNYYDLIDYPDLSNFVVDGNYVHTDNNFTDAEKSKLASLFNYTLPIATDKILGGVKIGPHMEMRQEVDEQGVPFGEFDHLSVIESHFIMVRNASANKFSDIPESSAGAMSITDMYSPTGTRTNGHYIRYNDMVFYSEDVSVGTKTLNGKTIKIDQDYLEKGGLWWTTKNSGQWIKVLDQFNIISFNDRVGKVYPVGMDDYLYEAEDYDANMVGAMARSGHPGAWTVIKNDKGRIIHQFWNGQTIDSLKIGDSGWARMGSIKWNAEKKRFEPDPVNSPTGGIITGTFWKLDGLPTLPTYNPDPYYPDTYRGAGKGSFFFMPDGQNRIWVKRGINWEDNDWFYLEQLPIATRERLGGIIVGDGLSITETGVLSVTGIVTSWTGKQGNRRVNEVVAINGDYDASMITFGDTWSSTNNVDYELKRLSSLINTKAPINSPAFTGTPTAPNPVLSDYSTRLATTKWVKDWVDSAIDDIVGYTLPIASSTVLGGIKVGSGLSIASDGTLSVNIQGSGYGSVVIDSALSTSSTNPVQNKVITNAINSINNRFGDYVLKVNGSANNLTVNGLKLARNVTTANITATYVTVDNSIKNDELATTAYVHNVVQDYITGLDTSGSGGVTITPYKLPIATGTTLGGVKITGTDGITISSDGKISTDYEKLNSSLDFITSKNIIGGANSYKTWDDIPANSSGYVGLQAVYSPTSKNTSGWYIKYNYGNGNNSYVLWFCDAETNDMWYLIHTPSYHGWSKTLSLDASQAEDFDLSKFALINSPVFTGDPQAPTPVYGSANNSSIVTVAYVKTAIDNAFNVFQRASYSDFGVVKIAQNKGLVVSGGVLENSGVISFKGRNGAVVPANDDYSAAMITYSGNSQSNVGGALNTLFSGKAGKSENNTFTGTNNFTVTPTVSGNPIATVSYVQNWKPIATTTALGMVKIGDGLQIDTDGILSTSGAVTGWTGNQGTRQSGEVIATAGDYNSNMIYYDPADSSKTVRSELDLKAYASQVWFRKDISALPTFSGTDFAISYSGGKYGSYGGHLMFPMSSASAEYGVIILQNDAKSYGNDVESIPNIYIASTYAKTNATGSTTGYVTTAWGDQIRLLTTRDLYSPNFTGTPTINGQSIFTSKVAGTLLGLVKNGGNVVVDDNGNMNFALPIASSAILGGVKLGGNIFADSNGIIDYALPIATATVLGGIKQGRGIVIDSSTGIADVNIATTSSLGIVQVGNGLSVDTNGVLSVSGAVTNFGPSGNKRSGDIFPEDGDYDATQVTYSATQSVKDKFDSLDISVSGFSDGSRLPIASSTQIGAVKIGDGISVDADGTISMNGVTSFNTRTGSVVPMGNEEDYTADMVGAIARKVDLTVDHLGKIPINSAGYLTYTGTSPISIEGYYICLSKPPNVNISVSNVERIVLLSRRYSTYINYDKNGSAMQTVNNVFEAGGEVLYSIGGGPSSTFTAWKRIDGVGSNIISEKIDSLTTWKVYRYASYLENVSKYVLNRSGVVSVQESGTATGDLPGVGIFKTFQGTATFLNISGELFATSESMYGVKNSLTIASFTDQNESNIQGLFYARGETDTSYNRNGAVGTWIKLIDTENITDYITDTSNLYNTENYTTTEVDDAIATTLAELG